MNRILANALNLAGQTLTSVGQGIKRYTASFTPAASAAQPTPPAVQRSMSTTTAGAMPPVGPDKPITPEQVFDTSLHPTGEPTASSLLRPGEVVRQPIKTGTDVSQNRIQQYLLARFNPIRGLTPRLLSTYLEQHDLGFIRYMALVFNKIRERDDAISGAMIAREAKPADMGWQILADDESEEAQQHKQALEYFYKNLSVTQCLDQNQRGGVSLMVRQMMRAVGDKFAVHEVVWVPGPDGLTAEMRYVPLWFFENRTGQLRFLPYELALQGIPTEPGGWMVHVGEGLFPVLSILYLYKQMGLKGWVAYMDKFQIPFLHGKTQAEYESAEWNQLVTAMQNFASDGGIVTKATTEITPIVMGSQGTAPHEPFCDRMDRAMNRVIRGGDLSSMSKGGGVGEGSSPVGSNAQQENEDMLAKADAERISETCQFYLDRWVIRYKFGPQATPKAKFAIQPAQDINTDREIAVDRFLLSAGVPIAITDLLERYDRQLPDETDSLASIPAGGSGFSAKVGEGDTEIPPEEQDASGSDGILGNVAPLQRRYYVTANQLRAKAQAKALEPLRVRLQAAIAITDPATRKAHLEAIRQELPKLLPATITPALVQAIDKSIATAMVNGAVAGARSTGYLHSRMNGTHLPANS